MGKTVKKLEWPLEDKLDFLNMLNGRIEQSERRIKDAKEYLKWSQEELAKRTLDRDSFIERADLQQYV